MVSEFIEVKEAAAMACISHKTLYDWIKHEKCRGGYKLKGKVLVKRREFKDWLDANIKRL